MNKKLILIFFIFTVTIFSQDKIKILQGQVILKDDGTPLEGVLISQIGNIKHSISDVNGNFRISVNINDSIKVNFQRIGLLKKIKSFYIDELDSFLKVSMQYEPINIGSVTVRANNEYNGKEIGTKTVIDKNMINHLQTSSLKDVLQLLPGSRFNNQSLTSPGQSLLRQVATTSDAVRINAFGTLLVLDGAPISNSANLQSDVTILNYYPGALPPFSSTAGRGNDLRQVAAENIDYVEIIRGIPSVRYGELTSGAIIVNTKTGAYAPQFSFKFNPTIKEFNAGYGFAITENKTFLSLNFNYAKSQNDPRIIEEIYNRYLISAGLKNIWIPQIFETDIRFQFILQKDEELKTPEDERYKRESWSKDAKYRTTLKLNYTPQFTLFDKLSYTASLSLGTQKSFYQRNISRDIFPITNATKDTTVYTKYGASSYLNKTTVSGKPINFYSRLEAEKTIYNSGLSFRNIAGIEFKYDANNGEGRQFDPTKPPLQNYSVGDRPRSYKDIPALNIFSAYIESRITGDIFSLPFVIQPGLRYDIIQPTSLSKGKFGKSLSPRINLLFQPLSFLDISAAYGESVKSPSLSFLYPGPRYFDLVNLNYYAQNPDERLAIVTTHVLKKNNKSLKEVNVKKVETTLGITLSPFRLNITGYSEKIYGGYGINRYAKVYPVNKYKIISTPEGKPPIIDPIPSRVDTFFGVYDAPSNTRFIHNYGLEFVLDIEEIRSISTSISVTGALAKTKSLDDAEYANTNILFSSAQIPQRIGIYPSGDGKKAEQFITSIRIVHRSALLGLLFSIHAQTIWWEKDKPVGYSSYPVAYMNRKGKVIRINHNEAITEKYKDLHRVYSKRALIENSYKKALWLFNLRVTKQISSSIDLSFYVNNVFNSRPLIRNTRSRYFVRRNIPIFFGAELNYRLKDF